MCVRVSEGGGEREREREGGRVGEAGRPYSSVVLIVPVRRTR